MREGRRGPTRIARGPRVRYRRGGARSKNQNQNQKQNDDNRTTRRHSQPAARHGLVEARRAVVELEHPAAAAAAGEALLEELRELAGEAAALERAPALVRGGVVRVVPVVESLAQF